MVTVSANYQEKNMHFKQLHLTIIGIVLLLGVLSVTAQSDSQSTFAFVSQSDAVLTFQRITVTDNRIETESYQHELPQYWALGQAAANPHNDWVMLDLRTQNLWALRGVNIATGEFREIANEIIFAPTPNAMSYPAQEFAWSSDGSYFAYNIATDTRVSETNTYLYNVENDVLIQLRSGLIHQTRLAWANHDNHLAIAVTDCTDSSCRHYIDIYDAPTAILVSRYDLSSQLPSIRSAYRSEICELSWSRDDRYLSFASTCDHSDPLATKEIYLLDTSTEVVQRITNFAFPQVSDDEFNYILAYYQTAWITPESLLISTIYDRGENQRSETYLYDVPQDTLNKIADGWVRNIAVNPVSENLAYQLITRDVLDHQFANQIQPIEITNSSEITQTNSIENRQTSIRELGCDPTWSPDGLTLAYYTTENSDCRYNPTTFWFIDTQSGALTAYVPQFENPPFYVISLGWVQP